MPHNPITITTGGTYTGTYESTDANTPVITISTTQPVTLSRVHITQKGYGIWAYDTHGTNLTITDCVFDQTDPGALVDHRAVRVNQPASFVFEYNILTDTDGVLVHGLTSLQVDPLRVNNNMCFNIGRYPRSGGGGLIQFLAFDNVVSPTGTVWWNHTQNLPGQSSVEDNIDFYVSGGTDSAHRFDIGWNLIDGAYPVGSDSGYTGGGINTGDGGGGHCFSHNNVVVSTTNYGIAVNNNDNFADSNLCVNDGAEQISDFGQAISAYDNPIPSNVVHATNTRYNWHRSTTDSTQYPCYPSQFNSGTQVSTTEQQARDQWEASRVAAGVTVGPRSEITERFPIVAKNDWIDRNPGDPEIPHVNTMYAADINALADIINGKNGGITFAQFEADPLGIADSTSQVQAAVTAAKAAGLPIFDLGGTYKLTDTIDARCTVSGSNQSDDFKGIIGIGRNATQFIQYTNNIPIFRLSGRYFTMRGFTAGFNTVQTTAQTAGNVFDLEDWIYFCIFDDLLIKNGYIGWNSKDGDRTGIGSGSFSNTFSNIRFEDNHYIHWTYSGGTGNHISNIYMGSDGIDRMYRGLSITGSFQDVWNQLNIESATFEDCALYDTASDSFIINSLHIEGCRFPCGSGERAIISTNAQGRSKIDIDIDTPFFGPHKVSGITRSGTTATATIDLLGLTLGGHGIRTGDTIVVSGANEAGYNVTATVTGVPTTTTVTYTVSGSPATPATLASGNDYIQMSLGAALSPTGIQIVKARNGAELIELDVRIRDARVTGNDRQPTLKFASGNDANARVKLRNLSTRGQIDNAHLPWAIDVVAMSRASNVVTAYTRIPHRLRVGNTIFVATGTGIGFGSQTVTAISGPHSFTYTASGADAPLVASPGDDLRMQTYATTQRARTSNIATLTIGTHLLDVGMRIHVSNTGGTGYTTADAVISAITSTTISYVSTGSNEGTTSDTAGSIMVYDPGVSFHYLTEPSDSNVLIEADFLYSGCECLDVGTVNAGAAATQTTTHYGVRVGDRIDWTPQTVLVDGLQMQAYASATDTITWRVFNPTAGNIVSGVKLVTYRFSRS